MKLKNKFYSSLLIWAKSDRKSEKISQPTTKLTNFADLCLQGFLKVPKVAQ